MIVYIDERTHYENRAVTMETNRILRITGSPIRISVERETLEVWYPANLEDTIEGEELK